MRLVEVEILCQGVAQTSTPLEVVATVNISVRANLQNNIISLCEFNVMLQTIKDVSALIFNERKRKPVNAIYTLHLTVWKKST